MILPAFNESESLPGVIEELRSAAADCDVLVIDDGSVDGTSEVSRGLGVTTITMPFNVGVGGALRAGLLFGYRNGYRAVVQCDGDGQHPPDRIGDLVAALADADLVIGARFAGIGDYSVKGPQKWAMRLLSVLLSALHRTQLTDTTSGFRAFGPRAIKEFSRLMPPEYLGDTLEALVIAKERRLVVSQVPVAMRERAGGSASHDPVKASVFLLRAVLIVALSLLRLLRRRSRRS